MGWHSPELPQSDGVNVRPSERLTRGNLCEALRRSGSSDSSENESEVEAVGFWGRFGVGVGGEGGGLGWSLGGLGVCVCGLVGRGAGSEGQGQVPESRIQPNKLG